MNLSEYDIAIIGAGPAGATCALALGASQLKVVLLDKATFPRDKICGDAIPARAARVLRTFSPAAADILAKWPQQTEINGCKVVAPNGKSFTYHFKIPGYCAARLDFDAFLLDYALQQPNLTFLPDTEAQAFERQGENWDITTSQGNLTAKLIIGCDGANGITARKLAGFQMHPDHHCAAVRAYWKGIEGLHPNLMEIHLLRGWLPGYFWIFPLPDGLANVGFGMLSSKVAQKKFALRQALPEMIAEQPQLKERFAQAEMIGKVEGFGLPLGSRMVKMSGDGFLLCGDAASLIDPATGEGIGNAMWSAAMAAVWATQAFGTQNFSASFLQGHDKMVRAELEKEMRQKHRAQQWIGSREWLLNWLIGQANKDGIVAKWAKKIF